MPNKIKIQQYSSPCGELRLGSYEGKLCLCNWMIEKHPGRIDHRLQSILKATYEYDQSGIDEYFRHERKMFDIPLLFVGTDFQKRVWKLLLKIPYGQTISYGTMAEKLGNPQAIRAVANANGANAISIFAPCHRVIGSNNSLTGYGGGLNAKKYLLQLEQEQQSFIFI